MKFGTLLGWGVVIYAVVALVSTGTLIYGYAGSLFASAAQLLVLVATAWVAGRSLRHSSWKDVLPYSVGWALIAAVLDALYVVPITGWGLYTAWQQWVGYGLIVVVPLIARAARPAHHTPRIT